MKIEIDELRGALQQEVIKREQKADVARHGRASACGHPVRCIEAHIALHDFRRTSRITQSATRLAAAPPSVEDLR
ncbi:MAG TPA: hypothetical protein VGQ76_20885 [Thermoanaerobaculia bacterium]|nr:hypothetical protein [Thermoanaerobaculia bacterium]